MPRGPHDQDLRPSDCSPAGHGRRSRSAAASAIGQSRRLTAA